MGSGIVVVTATVNRRGLRKAADSVQAQTLKPDRHIILAQQLMKTPRLNLVPPTSVPVTIEWMPPPQPHLVDAYLAVEVLGLREPGVRYLAMLDDDCWWSQTHLEHLVPQLEEAEADFAWSSSCLYDERGRPVGFRDDDLPAFQHIDNNEILYRPECVTRWGSFRMADHRGIDGKRIERWVENGAKHVHGAQRTCHYTWREEAEF